jgi:hypothetical protein
MTMSTKSYLYLAPDLVSLGDDGGKLEILGKGHTWSLAQLNDSGDFNFSMIADLIENFVIENQTMRESLKRAWIAALRSGDYAQARGRLCYVSGSDQSFCCLGVLCEVAGLPRSIANSGAVFYAADGVGALPTHFAAQQGISPTVVLQISDHTRTTLVDLNDEEKLTFSQIADTIEYLLPAEPDETTS